MAAESPGPADPTAPEELGGRSALSRVRRLPELARYDRQAVHAVFDEARFCHIGFLVDERPVVLPTIHDRRGDDLFLHGSRSSRMLRAMTAPQGACVTATLFDGLVLARSVFNHTVAYRSAVAFGHPVLVTEPEEKRAALAHFVEHVLPGRSAEARAPDERELGLTSVVRMRIEEASAKVEAGPPDDHPEDLALPVWAGVVPARTSWGEPVQHVAGAGAAGAGAALPASVRRLVGR